MGAHSSESEGGRGGAFLNMIELELPYPPSANRYWRNVRGMVMISKEGRQYRQDVVNIIKAHKVEPIAGAVAVKLISYAKDWRRRDVDNLNKAALDAVSKSGIWEDDSFICALICEKRKDEDGLGRVILQIKQVDGAIVKKSGAWLK